jgi:tRNA(Ile)-lysidine synthase
MIMTVDSKSLLLREIKNSWPVKRWFEFGVIVAVSGGADSVCLLRAIHEIRNEEFRNSNEVAGKVWIAHFNHKLRGEASDADCEFVKELANDLGMQFLSENSNGSAASENSLRDERYRFLESSARKTNSRYIATAHHRDDQVETVLFRLFRGTGLKGLTGIPQSRVVDESLTIVRPMLSINHQMIVEALRAWDQPFRCDASNAESDFSRNFIRNEVLPLLRPRFGSVDDSIARLSYQAGQQQEYLSEQVSPLLRCVESRPGRITIKCEQLANVPRVIIRELLVAILSQQDWLDSQLGFDELDRLAGIILVAEDQPKFQLPGCVSCEKRGDIVALTKQ